MLSMTAAPALARPGDATRDGVTSASTSSATSTTQDVRVLVFHGDPAEQEDPVLEAANTITELGAEHGFAVTTTSDPADFTEENLDGYRGVVFLSAEGTELDSDQEGALREFVNDG